MYVCICSAVTERQIIQAASQGATKLKDLRTDLGVAGECGRCADCARQCLREAIGHIRSNQTCQPGFAPA